MTKRKAFLLQTCNLHVQTPLEPGLAQLMLIVVTLCNLGVQRTPSIGSHGGSPETGHPNVMLMVFRIVNRRFSKQARSEGVQESMLNTTTM